MIISLAVESFQLFNIVLWFCILFTIVCDPSI
uniref:Uncharacterized protein n=1 Tax=Rhizophora mucronata TaxID=61149 RepID=A0A2P2NZW4_RHIMU